MRLWLVLVWILGDEAILFARERYYLFQQKRTDIRMIQDYFGKTVGSVKKVLLTYGPEGRSRGIAQITFSSPTSGNQAAKQLDGVKVDNRPMKVRKTLTCM